MELSVCEAMCNHSSFCLLWVVLLSIHYLYSIDWPQELPRAGGEQRHEPLREVDLLCVSARACVRACACECAQCARACVGVGVCVRERRVCEREGWWCLEGEGSTNNSERCVYVYVCV